MPSIKRILLRALERDDLKLFHKWQNDEEIMRLARSQPDHMISMEALAAEFDKNLKGEDATTRRFGIEERSTGKLIGWCSISFNSWAKRFTSADIGLAIGEKDRWRKGYGTEIVKLLLKECFEQLNLHRLGWWTFAENKASIALAEKLGFREEGRLRENVFFDNAFHDTIVMGLTRDEYARSRKP
ncbi:MAG TPA: GNAT family protein [Candidatus Dormibacteraeota bacterium]|nr:GNAT family protein [Candidatus Dormibacteraeota bacterium]